MDRSLALSRLSLPRYLDFASMLLAAAVSRAWANAVSATPRWRSNVTRRLRLTGGRHTRGVRCLALDAVRQHLFSGDGGGNLTRWDFGADSSRKRADRHAYV